MRNRTPARRVRGQSALKALRGSADVRVSSDEVMALTRDDGSRQKTKRGKITAKIEPETETAENKRPPMPDFEARLKEIYGDKVFEVSGAELISADREDPNASRPDDLVDQQNHDERK